jgi:hypothetical protein
MVPGAQAEETGAVGAASASAPASYVDVEQYVIGQGDAPYQQWWDLGHTLAANFDDVCGDTFCEGDYSNLVPLRFRCTVNEGTGALKVCTYVFAGSYEDVSPSTGTIRVNAKTFSCHVPVSGIKLADFLATMTATGSTSPLQRPLPGTGKSIYDALAGCL